MATWMASTGMPAASLTASVTDLMIFALTSGVRPGHICTVINGILSLLLSL